MTEVDAYPLDQWAHVASPPACSGVIRQYPTDFVVQEDLGFKPDGEGKHLWVYIEKTDLNTIDVCRGLARAAGIHQKEIGVSGQKDRNAVTSQWFSVLAETAPAECRVKVEQYCADNAGLRLLEATFHPGKLKRGSHRSNRFQLTVRNLSGELTSLEEALARIAREGVPNYFGPQRFGRNGKNMITALRFFNGENRRLDRQARSMALSSARSWIFNQVVSERLRKNGFNSPQIGDALMLDGTQSWFVHDGSDEQITKRWQSLDLHVTAPMWGKGDLPTRGETGRFEQEVVNGIAGLPVGLEKQGLVQQRRATRIVPTDFNWKFPESRTLQLQFALSRGGFATAVLRELVQC